MHTLFFDICSMTEFLVLSLLVGLNAFFSLSEVALLSARPARLRTMERMGSTGAAKALQLKADPDTLFSTVQIAITIISIFTGIYSGEALSHHLAAAFASWGIALGWADLWAKTVIVLLATYVQCVLGEIFPKRVALAFADTVSATVAPAIVCFAWLTKPFGWLLRANTEALLRLFGVRVGEQSVTEEEVISIIQEGANAGEVQAVEQDIMERTLALGDLRISALMTHITDLVMLPLTATADQVRALLAEEPHSVFPVYGSGREDVLGYVSLKDLVLALGAETFDLASIIREPLYFPENMSVYTALEKLREAQAARALVCDEYGTLQGILSFKDIFEGLVGDLPDQSEQPDIVPIKDGTAWEVSGQCLYYEFADYFELAPTPQGDYTTVSGLLLTLIGYIPAVGQHADWQDLRLTITAMKQQRIRKVEVTRLSTTTAPSTP